MALLKPNLDLMSSAEMKLGGEGDWLRMLLMGDAKVGKTFTVLKTCVQPVFIINCDQPSALRGPLRHGLTFQTTKKPVHTEDEMKKALAMAKYLVKEQGYKTVVWDTLSVYATQMLKEMQATRTTRSGAPDTRAAWGAFGDNLLDFTDRILKLPCHVIVNTHWMDEHEELVDDDGNPDNVAKRKAAKGKVPLIQGRAKRLLPTMFDDIVLMKMTSTKNSQGGRVFETSSQGVYGPGGRSVDVSEMTASIKGFMREAGMLPPLKSRRLEEK